MAVTDVTVFRRHLAVVHNTDRAASGQIADYVCRKYGIPTANKIGIAMSTSAQWAYDAGRYSTVFGTLNTHLTTIGATGVLLCEGSPNRMNLPLVADPSNITSSGIDTARMLALTKRIVAVNAITAFGEPRLYDADQANRVPMYQYPRTDAWTVSQSGKTGITGNRRGALAYEGAEYNSYISIALDADMEAARGSYSGVGTSMRKAATFAPGFDRDFSRFDMLPYGRIGLPKFTTDDTFDADLYAKSKAIIDRGIAFERSMSRARADTRILFPVADVGSFTGAYNLGKQVLAQKKAQLAGFAALNYWYEDGAVSSGDLAANAMANPAHGLRTLSNWTTAELNSGTANPITFDIAVGGGLMNDKADTWCATSNGMVPASTGAIVMGGASYLYQWVQRLVDLNRFVAAFCNPYVNGGSYHHSDLEMESTTDVFRALLDGMSLMEASVLCYENAHYAMGNPLVRPFAS